MKSQALPDRIIRFLQAPPAIQAKIDRLLDGEDPEAPTPKPISTRKAAELLSVHKKTLWRWEKRGILHPARISKRKILFDLSEISELLRKGAGTGEAVSL